MGGDGEASGLYVEGDGGGVCLWWLTRPETDDWCVL